MEPQFSFTPFLGNLETLDLAVTKDVQSSLSTLKLLEQAQIDFTHGEFSVSKERLQVAAGLVDTADREHKELTAFLDVEMARVLLAVGEIDGAHDLASKVCEHLDRNKDIRTTVEPYILARELLAVILAMKAWKLKAIEIEEEVVHSLVEIKGPDHPMTWRSQYTLSSMLCSAGHYDRALEIAQHVRALTEEHFGFNSSPPLLGAMTVSLCNYGLENFEAAYELIHHASMTAQASAKVNSLYVAYASLIEAFVSTSTRHVAESVMVVRSARGVIDECFPQGTASEMSAISRMVEAACLSHAGNMTSASELMPPLWHATLDEQSNALPIDFQWQADFLEGQRTSYCSAGHYEISENIARSVLEFFRTRTGPDSISTLTASCMLATTLSASGKSDEAINLAISTLDSLERNFGVARRESTKAAGIVAVMLVEVGQLDAASELVDRFVPAMYDGSQLINSPQDLNAISMLEVAMATLLAAQGDYDSAIFRLDTLANALATEFGPEHVFSTNMYLMRDELIQEGQKRNRE